ncbi:probable G-protein coupled receptor 83 [Patiria miniata]|uniref:G-protein coupled receptors family 1 profile domain-containing protein n=1 Tax=Patiria miniata TaxID=46514 RepID=A0A914B4W8_PATMI|nr:probable G-protein coupled receptor 83 [Patiria miniata]XP_038071118.1 probable G-protein coupled receptor 83 [Patiria miniata]
MGTPFKDLAKLFDNKINNTNFSGDSINATAAPANRPGFEFQKVPAGTVAAFIPLYTSVVILSLLGNALVCLAVVRNKRMRSVTNFFLANQALSDIVMTILNIPFTAYHQMVLDWPFGDLMCHLAEYMGMMSVYVSTFTLTAIALDRHRYIMYPHRPRIAKRTALGVASFVWALALLLSIPYALFRQTEIRNGATLCLISVASNDLWFWKYVALVTFFIQLLIPLAVISAAYLRIYLKLRARGNVGSVMAQHQRANNKAKQRTTLKLVLFVAVFAVCWCPLNLYVFVTNFNQKLKSSVLYLCLHWFAMCSVCINPVAFAFLNKNFRSGLKATLRCARVNDRAKHSRNHTSETFQ